MEQIVERDKSPRLEYFYGIRLCYIHRFSHIHHEQIQSTLSLYYYFSHSNLSSIDMQLYSHKILFQIFL